MEANQLVVIDIGGTKIRYGRCVASQLFEIGEIPTPKVSTPQFVDAICGAIQTFFDQHEIKGLGVASAGPIDFEKGEIRNPANLGNGDNSWMNFSIEKNLHEKLQCPVKVDNDAALTARGFFHHFEKSGHKDIVLLTLGTGLGVGAIVNGQSVRAGQSMHPELGHFIVADKESDYQTPFAGFPTLESYLSGTHFSKRVGRALNRELNGAQLLEISGQQDEKVLKLWEEYSRRMAVAWTNLYLAYFPQKIVLAGGFSSAAKEFYFERSLFWFEKLMAERVRAGMVLPEIMISANSDDLPLLGAAHLIDSYLQ